jgi:hypothetical protein
MWFSMFFSWNAVSRDCQSDKHRSEIVIGIIMDKSLIIFAKGKHIRGEEPT